MECLPVLQSLHHLFALDSGSVCEYWPNKNRAFIAPGGPCCGHITADTNIPTLNSCPPAAVSSKSERTNSQRPSLALFRPHAAHSLLHGAAPAVEATGDTCLLFSAGLGRLPRVDPRVNYFQSSWDLYHSHTGASGSAAPLGSFPSCYWMGRDRHHGLKQTPQKHLASWLHLNFAQIWIPLCSLNIPSDFVGVSTRIIFIVSGEAYWSNKNNNNSN